jgi:hypothetical protein
MTGFEVLGRRGFLRPAGEMTLERAIEQVAQALARARELELEDFLVNATGLGGFDAPAVFERYAMFTRWVQCAGLSLRIAIVVRSSFIDHQKIGVLIAQNRGLSAEVFADEASALAWLDARRLRGGVRWSASRRPAGY